MDLAKHVLTEPEIANTASYRKRITLLAVTFTLIFLVCIAGDALLVMQVKRLVTLAQRSNVETLTLAFFLLFFTYLAVICAPGARGAANLLYYAALQPLRGSAETGRRMIRRLGTAGVTRPSVALNLVLERVDRPRQPFEIRLRDEVADMGILRIDGARVEHVAAYRDGSNTLFAYFKEQVLRLLSDRGENIELDIVEWKKVDDEATESYLSLVTFSRNLEKALDAPELWPKARLTAADCETLEKRLSELCPTLRQEAFLPQWEYTGEHKLPIIPEPLGIISLSRSEKRVDPLSSMTACLVVVVIAFVLLVLLILYPPWVPGK